MKLNKDKIFAFVSLLLALNFTRAAIASGTEDEG
jgi:hypothetical protein